MVASLSMNQINWDGNPDTLPSWDDVAGTQTTDYSETYQVDGNTLVLMSMNVSPKSKGQQLPAKIIEYVKLLAQAKGAEHIIGSFRPSGFGKAKLEMLPERSGSYYAHMKGLDKDMSQYPIHAKYGQKSLRDPSQFWSYCIATVPGTEKPIDPWLRSLWWAGMKLLKEDQMAMDVSVSQEEFDHYQHTYYPGRWQRFGISQGNWETWECGEVGVWKRHLDDSAGPVTQARYFESNVWGTIPFK